MLNFIPRHWRGEYSLPVSYWVFGILIAVFMRLFTVGLRYLATFLPYNPTILFLLYCTVWLSVGVMVIWHFGGVWRSANAQAVEKPGRLVWVWAAKAAVLLGLLQAIIALFVFGGPQFSALFDMAFKGDTKIPNYTLNVENGGTELRFDGGIKYGLASDIEKIISENQSIRIIAFNSAGGRVGEAQKLFHVLRDANINAVVNERCVSACALAFAGGRHRWLGLGGVLGFHNASFIGLSELSAAEGQAAFVAEIQEQDNIPADFFGHVTGVRSKDMWYPTKKELLDSNYLTEKVSEAESSKKKIQNLLTDFAIEIRKSLPKSLDSITTLIGVEVDQNRLIYSYEITKSGEGFFYNDVFKTALSQKISSVACRNDGIRSALNAGVVYEYRYVNADLRKLILDYTLTECS